MILAHFFNGCPCPMMFGDLTLWVRLVQARKLQLAVDKLVAEEKRRAAADTAAAAASNAKDRVRTRTLTP